MENVVLVIHLLLALAIIGLVLLQRSEGGGLGIGGGSGGLGNFATAAGTANALTRATAICAACFFATSLTLGILAGMHNSVADEVTKALDNPVPAVDSAVQKEDKETPEAEATGTDSSTPPSAPISE